MRSIRRRSARVGVFALPGCRIPSRRCKDRRSSAELYCWAHHRDISSINITMRRPPERVERYLSLMFPGTVEQFRGQVQRLRLRAIETWGESLFMDRRLSDLLLEPGEWYGLWKSKADDLLGYREVHQLKFHDSNIDDILNISPTMDRFDWRVIQAWTLYRHDARHTSHVVDSHVQADCAR